MRFFRVVPKQWLQLLQGLQGQAAERSNVSRELGSGRSWIPTLCAKISRGSLVLLAEFRVFTVEAHGV